MNDRARARGYARATMPCPCSARTHIRTESPIQPRNKLDAPGIRYLHGARTRQCIRRCLFTIKLEASTPPPFLARQRDDSGEGPFLGATVNDHILCAPTYPLARSGIPRRVSERSLASFFFFSLSSRWLCLKSVAWNRACFIARTIILWIIQNAVNAKYSNRARSVARYRSRSSRSLLRGGRGRGILDRSGRAFFRSPLRSYRERLEKTSRNPAAIRRDAGISIGDELPWR